AIAGGRWLAHAARVNAWIREVNPLSSEMCNNALEMGYLFEDLIRRFSETSNETAGEHYTPREVIRLIVSLLLINDRDALTGTGVIRQVYDPAAGTGGMLSIAEMEMKALNERIRVELFGQELNPESFAICKSDMLVM
ncbi:class I SAM-dependent DNA methyltransferase, partial [Aquicoccus sp.]|uniref:HsdM family class I SAM-dependent methyltransferase n=1 Tax=Aquicoccus sp. TaxID=2055851 RepID=UPI003568FBBF